MAGRTRNNNNGNGDGVPDGDIVRIIRAIADRVGNIPPRNQDQNKSEMIAKFEKLRPYKFLGGSNPHEAEAWLRQIKKLLDTSDVRNEQDRVTMAAFQMEGEADHWWEMIKSGHRRSECPQGGEYFMDQRGAQQYNRCQPGQGSKPTQTTQTNKGQPQASKNAGRPRTQPQGAENGKKPGETNQQAVWRMYALQEEEDVDNPSVIQGMLILMNSWVKVLFDSGASYSFISTACATSLGLELEALEIAMSVTSPLGGQTRVNLVCKSCELEISGSHLICDLRVMGVSDFDVILGMDWLPVHRAIIDCYCKTVTASSLNGTKVQFKGDRQDSLTPTYRKSRWHDQLTGWLASLILEDENREDPGLPHVVCEYVDVFPDELPRLPPKRDVDFTIELQPGASSILIAPHRMAPAELRELKEQLQELLDKKLIRPSTSP
ncbi:uncharacterized protein LOC114264598 [Camellia sinensis]|uniref:uncharacterized protein LOC114264598 n=1 Tax=Camellia sinensis TaxID=4442 RepID=UPI0010355B30|nr:uncharacterized protein LOC114264598 [Camellia sinensis]